MMNFIKGNYKKIIIGALMIMLIIGLIGGSGIKTNGYSVDNVYNTIAELSSPKYEGRVHGSEGNKLAVNYIANEFEKIGLKPAGDKGTYFINYTNLTRINTGKSVLELLDDKGNLVKAYEYGKDFIESGRGYDIPGEITSGYSFLLYSVENKNEPNKDKQVAISRITTDSQQDRQRFYSELQSLKFKAFLAVTKNSSDLLKISGGLGNRTLAETGYEIPTLTIKERVKDELIKYENKNYKLHVKTVIAAKGVQVSDVIGYIPGKTNDTLLITAHMDHLGITPDGALYPGALDNASGTASIIEIARFIKSQGKKPSKNIVFIAFNAEEAGCIGSEKYARKPKFPLVGTTVLNLDMVGANREIPITLMSYSYYDYYKKENNDPSSKLTLQLTRLCEELGFDSNTANEPSSDHLFFNLRGVPAVTLIDHDSSSIHRPTDDISNINKGNLDRALKLATNYVNLTAFSKGLLRGNSMKANEVLNFVKLLYPLLIALFVMIVLGYLYYIKVLKNSNLKKLRFPIVTITFVLLLCTIISYLPIVYPYAPNPDKGIVSLFVEGLISIAKSFVVWPNYFGFFGAGAIILVITKRRISKLTYKGDASEYNTLYNISALAIVATSIIGNYLFYNKEVYYPVTPDFGRSLAGKIILHVVFALMAYLLFKFARYETGGKEKGFKSLIAFSLIFFLLLSAFYMPITINKYVIDKNSMSVFRGESTDPIE